MLLKYTQYQKRSKLGANGKPHRGSVTGSRIPNKGKGHRKGKIASSKRLNGHKIYVAKREEEINRMMTVDPTCDNSNDSGLGFEQVDYQPHSTSFNNQYWSEEVRVKRPRVDIKLESDNANDNFTFPQAITIQPHRIFVDKTRKAEVAKSKIGGGKISGGKAGGRSVGKRGCTDASTASITRSRDGTISLEILSQPETQHRARYQTEGSRGAVKDTTGNSFPLVKLTGYEGSEMAVLQVYIGTDQGKVAPHMFYQACKVSGKNSTPCTEKKLNGTAIIEIEFNPTNDNLVLCDCVGILKERNVDVEHRFPEEVSSKSRKKSTRCRMVFRTTITLPSGQSEVLQVTSHPIACTQPPGIPEISKKSLSSCPVTGNNELFIIGKNFLKDTKVMFSEGEPSTQDYWECIVQPDKEFLHQSHLVCTVPMYHSEDIKKAANVCVSVVSGGKSSEPVLFSYTPVGTFPSQHLALQQQSIVCSDPATTTSSFYAVTQSLGAVNQTIVPGVPEGSSFATPQKIIIIPTSMDLNSSSIVSTSLAPEDKDMIKNEGGVWIKEKIGVISSQMVVPGSALTQQGGLVQSCTEDNIILGVSPVPGMVQSSSSASSPPLLQESNVSQSPNLIQVGVSQPSTLIQVSDMVHSSGVLQATSTPGVLCSPSGVLHSSDLSTVSLSTSPVLQNSTLKQSPANMQPTLSESPIINTLSPTTSLVHNSCLVPSPNLVQTQSITTSDLIQSSSIQSIVSPANIVTNLSHPHIISPTLDSSSNMVQSPPNLVKPPNLVLSPNLVHSQSPPVVPTAELPHSSSIVHSVNVMDSTNLTPTTLLSDPTNPSNLIPVPVTTIAEAASIIQTTGMIENNPIVQANHLVNTVSMISSGLSDGAIRSANVETSGMIRGSGLLQETGVSSDTSMARGLESTTPGGAASAVADLSSGQLPSMATIEKFVTGTPLPALSVETYLSHIENKPKVGCQQTLLTTFPTPTQQESPIAIKQIVVAAAAAALESKPTETAITYPGKIIDTLNREVLHHNPVISQPSDMTARQLNYPTQEFLQPQPTNFQLIPRQDEQTQGFTTPQFSSPPIFPPAPLYPETATSQVKLVTPKTVSPAANTKKCEEGMPVPHELTVMSENDLISYINPSCFDQV